MAINASIRVLLAGEQVAGSKLNNRLLDELLAEGLLLVLSRGSRNRIGLVTRRLLNGFS